MRVELESPKLADYLEKPRLVNAILTKPSPTAEAAKGHHAKRYENGGVPEYRNLRLGNFMEEDEAANEEVIPDLLRQYYLDTFLNSKYDMYQITHSMWRKTNNTSDFHLGYTPIIKQFFFSDHEYTTTLNVIFFVLTSVSNYADSLEM